MDLPLLKNDITTF